MLELSEKAVAFAAGQGLPVMFVTEDTTRANPDDLRRLYTTAVEAGARRVCVADTVGHATPNGAAALTRFIREVVDATGEDVKVDWHGHRDRGLGEINALAAAAAGADRLHGTALGVGERVGNAPMDLLRSTSCCSAGATTTSRAAEYCRLVAEAPACPSRQLAVVGIDAFRTGTGVHAAAILKARAKGDDWLATASTPACRLASSAAASGRGGAMSASPTSSSGCRRTASRRGRSWWRRSSSAPRHPPPCSASGVGVVRRVSR